MKTTTDRVTALIVEHLGVDPKEVTPEASFREDLDADSFDRIELTLAIEEAFDIEIVDQDAETILRVGDLVAYVTQRIGHAV